MSDVQASTARDRLDSFRGSNEGVARPKRVTSFTVNQAKSANNSGNNTAGNVKESQTMRSNPTMNKKSEESNHTLTSREGKGSYNSGVSKKQKFDPTQGLLGETNPMKMMYGPSLLRKKSSERDGESAKKKPGRISAKTMRQANTMIPNNLQISASRNKSLLKDAAQKLTQKQMTMTVE